jgi:anti-sigma factor RsiW
MQHLEEGTIHAWLDDELSPAERAEAEAHVAGCAECAAAVAEARGFIAASSRILTALDAVPGGVLPAASTASGAPARAMPRRFVARRAWMAVAAVLVLSTVTVIATRSGDDTAQFQIATATRDKTAMPASAAPAQDESGAMKPGKESKQTADSHAVGAVARSSRDSSAAAPKASAAAGNAVSKNAPTPMQSRAAAPAEEPKPADQTERLKSRLEAERKSTLVRPSVGEPFARADAAPPPRAAQLQAPASPRPDTVAEKDLADKREAAAQASDALSGLSAAANARGLTITGRVTSEAGAPLASASVVLEGTGVATTTGADGSYALAVPAARANGQTTSLVARLIGYRAVAVPITPSDTPITHDFVLAANPLALSEVIVTDEGARAGGKPARVTGTDESPAIVSRHMGTESGDTVVTTIYAVRGGTVTLLERRLAQDALERRQRSASFSDQVMAKARDDTRINSITWSDSTGRTRTLQGTVPRERLERIRTALFGATP